MDRTATIPTESIVTFSKHGKITKVEHITKAEIPVTEENVVLLLNLMGTTIEEICETYEARKLYHKKVRT